MLFYTDLSSKPFQPCILIFPTFQACEIAGKKPRYKSRMPAFNHFFTAKILKFANCSMKQKISVPVAITAIFSAFVADGVGSSALRILFHRQAATLAKFVFCAHFNSRNYFTYNALQLRFSNYSADRKLYVPDPTSYTA